MSAKKHHQILIKINNATELIRSIPEQQSDRVIDITATLCEDIISELVYASIVKITNHELYEEELHINYGESEPSLVLEINKALLRLAIYATINIQWYVNNDMKYMQRKLSIILKCITNCIQTLSTNNSTITDIFSTFNNRKHDNKISVITVLQSMNDSILKCRYHQRLAKIIFSHNHKLDDKFIQKSMLNDMRIISYETVCMMDYVYGQTTNLDDYITDSTIIAVLATLCSYNKEIVCKVMSSSGYSYTYVSTYSNIFDTMLNHVMVKHSSVVIHLNNQTLQEARDDFSGFTRYAANKTVDGYTIINRAKWEVDNIISGITVLGIPLTVIIHDDIEIPMTASVVIGPICALQPYNKIGKDEKNTWLNKIAKGPNKISIKIEGTLPMLIQTGSVCGNIISAINTCYIDGKRYGDVVITDLPTFSQIMNAGSVIMYSTHTQSMRLVNPTDCNVASRFKNVLITSATEDGDRLNVIRQILTEEVNGIYVKHFSTSRQCNQCETSNE
jgi:hypothetical protein